MLDIPINGDSIKLGQFIKLASLVATGGEAKELIAEGVVTVNGEPETRRGATLHPGDEVCIEDACAHGWASRTKTMITLMKPRLTMTLIRKSGGICRCQHSKLKWACPTGLT